jgi:hypothetical protein
MHTKHICLSIFQAFLLIASTFAILSAGQEQSIDMTLAEQYFREARALCDKDDGKLWGVPLYGPMLLVDPATRLIVANQGDPQARLSKKGDVFVGRLPEEIGIANTATDWAGMKWTMIIWPLPSAQPARASLMIHESYHRIQNEIGLPATNPSNNHLDTLEGRLFLQLEWRALRLGLQQTGAESRRAVEDALIFRAHRRKLFPQSAQNESSLEMNEGLAEYTGIKLRGTPDADSIDFAAGQLESYESKHTFVRSFAYASGPAYGLLLDRSNPGWRKGLKSGDDLGVVLAEALSIKLPANVEEAVRARAGKYNGDALRASEVERDNFRKKRVASYRERFMDKPVLVLPFTKDMRYTFNPGSLEALDESNTVYPTMTASDAWGILTVTGGALMTRETGEIRRVTVSAPVASDARQLKGDGWTLELNAGWKIAPGPRKGDYILKANGQP